MAIIKNCRKYTEIINGKKIEVTVSNNGKPSEKALDNFTNTIIKLAKKMIIEDKLNK